MFAFSLVVAIPLISIMLFERRVYAFLVSAPLGAIVLWANMVSIEARASESDFDLIFGIACLFWAVVLICGYAALCFLSSLLRLPCLQGRTAKKARKVEQQKNAQADEGRGTASGE